MSKFNIIMNIGVVIYHKTTLKFYLMDTFFTIFYLLLYVHWAPIFSKLLITNILINTNNYFLIELFET